MYHSGLAESEGNEDDPGAHDEQHPATSIINDRPIGVRHLSEEEIVPLTVNQLLLGRSTTLTRVAFTEIAQENYMAANDYQEELLSQWWNRWKVIGLPHMIPYQRFKDAKRHKNLVKGDVCLLQYDGKIKHTYRLSFQAVMGEEQDQTHSLVCITSWLLTTADDTEF